MVFQYAERKEPPVRPDSFTGKREYLYHRQEFAKWIDDRMPRVAACRSSADLDLFEEFAKLVDSEMEFFNRERDRLQAQECIA
jgi:hypothetical protein